MIIFRHLCVRIAILSLNHRVIDALQETLRVRAHSILSVRWALLGDQFISTSLHIAQQLSRPLELDDLLGVVRRDALLYQLGQLLLLRTQEQSIKLVRRRVVGKVYMPEAPLDISVAIDAEPAHHVQHPLVRAQNRISIHLLQRPK